jgi:hypothetical protein
MTRQFIVSIHVSDIDPKQAEDLEGEVNEAISNHFGLDPDVGFGVVEVE